MQHPAWVDPALYPFTPRFLDFEAGRMHYVDEGSGPPLLFVHGTPAWSFLYRDLIRALSARHRVVAPDHLGFGLSDKPAGAPYRPEDHAERLHALVERLALRDVTLVVHDFGGPIGLSYAIRRPENVRALVLFNTWMWSTRGDARTERASRLLGGPLGRFLYTRLNFSPRFLLRAAFGDRSKLTPAVHRHYLAPFPTPSAREAPWRLAGALLGSSGWYDELWRQRERIREKPALLLWGMKDPAFREEALRRWEELFTRARTVRFPEAGHFVPEEAPAAVLAALEEFLG